MCVINSGIYWSDEMFRICSFRHILIHGTQQYFSQTVVRNAYSLKYTSSEPFFIRK